MTCLTVSAGERRAPISIVCGFRMAHWMSVSICGGMVAEKSEVWRSRGHFLNDAADVRQKAHVQHAVRLVQHQVFDVVEPAGAAFHMVQQAVPAWR